MAADTSNDTTVSNISTREFSIDSPPKNPIPCITSSPSSPPPSPSPPPFIFTHGANGSLTSAAVVNFRLGFAPCRPITVFQGNMNLASRVKMFNVVIDDVNLGRVGEGKGEVRAIGGRSMGARAAVMAAKDRGVVKELVLVSYPLVNGGDVRDQILLDIESDVKVLFMGGDRDEMCDLEMLEEVRRKMKAKSWRVVVRGAGHGLDIKPKRGTQAVGEMVGRVAAEWIGNSDEEKLEGDISWDNEDEGVALWSGWGNEVGEKASSGEPERSGKETKDNGGSKEKKKNMKEKRKTVENHQSKEKKKKTKESNENPQSREEKKNTKRKREPSKLEASEQRRSKRIRDKT